LGQVRSGASQPVAIAENQSLVYVLNSGGWNRVRVQFRVEMFNVFNRINSAQPVVSLGSGSAFGWSTSTIGVSHGAPGIGSGEPYNTQLSLKILF
jgi:hypothetical protein